MDTRNIIFIDLPDSPLTRQVLPLFEEFFLQLVKTAPNQPDLQLLEDCFRAFNHLSPEILDILDTWSCPLYGHTLLCYVKLLYPSYSSTSTNNKNDNSSLVQSPTSATSPTPSTPSSQSIDSSSTTISNRDAILNLFSKYNCKCIHESCEFITVLHSFLSTIQFSPKVSKNISPIAFNLISEKYLNYYDSLDDLSPLMIAINNPYTTRVVDALISTKKIQLNVQSKNGKTPLQHCIQRGNSPESYRICKSLLDAKAELYSPQLPHAQQPLALAINTRCDQLGELLVQYGYPVNSHHSLNVSSLHAAISQHMTSTALALLNNKATVGTTIGSDGNTILHHACSFNNPEVVSKLLEFKIPVDCVNTNNQTSLELLMQLTTSHHHVIKLLLKNGANANKVTKNVPILCQALFRHNYDQVRALLSITAKEKEQIESEYRAELALLSPKPTQSSKSTTTLTPTPVQRTQSASNLKSTSSSSTSPSSGGATGWFRSLFGSSKKQEQSTSPKPKQKELPTQQEQSPFPIIILPNVNIHCPRPIYYGSPFLFAVHSAPQDIVEIMIRYFHASLLQKNDHHMTCLHIAVSREKDITIQQETHFNKQNHWIQGKLGSLASSNDHRQSFQIGRNSFHHTDSPLQHHSHTNKHNDNHHNHHNNNNQSQTRTASTGSFHSLASPSLNRSPSHTSTSSLSSDRDSSILEQNRMALAKSFHISCTIYDPLEASPLPLTRASLNTIPHYDPQQQHFCTPRSPTNKNNNNNTIPLSPMSSNQHSSSSSSSSSIPTTQLKLSLSHDQLSQPSSLSSTPSSTTTPTAVINTDLTNTPSMTQSPATLSTFLAPTPTQEHNPLSSSPQQQSTTIQDDDSVTILIPTDNSEPSIAPPLTTTLATPPSEFDSNSFHPHLLSPIQDVDDAIELCLPTQPFEPNPEIESIVNWNQIENEDEDVIFLARLLKTIHEHFHHPNDDEGYELL